MDRALFSPRATLGPAPVFTGPYFRFFTRIQGCYVLADSISVFYQSSLHYNQLIKYFC